MTKERPNRESSSSTVQSVERTLNILEVLSDEGAPMSISELAEKVGLKVSTVHRLLNTLVQRGFVKQDEDTHKYRLSFKLLRMGRTVLDSYDLRTIAKPFMKELLERCNETTNLSILDGGDVVYIDQLESTNLILARMFARVGSRGPAHCTATGKAMLADLPGEGLDRILKNMSFEKFTDKTITDLELLKKELDKVRESGYALDLGEREEEVRCVAAPVKNHEGKVVGAIGVSGPKTRITDDYLENELIPAVCDVADKFSEQMGYVKKK